MLGLVSAIECGVWMLPAAARQGQGIICCTHPEVRGVVQVAEVRPCSADSASCVQECVGADESSTANRQEWCGLLQVLDAALDAVSRLPPLHCCLLHEQQLQK